MERALKENVLARTASKVHRAAFSMLYRDLAGVYEGVVRAFGYQAPEVVAEAIVPYLNQFSSPKILDAGCGTGLTGKALKNLKADIDLYGFDFSREMIERAKKLGLYGNHLYQADACKKLPFDNASFDAAVSSGLYTLGHVGPEALLPVLHTIRQDGLFCLNIFEPAWQKLNFEEALNALIEQNLIEIVHHHEACHWKMMKNKTTRVLILKIKADFRQS